MFQRNWVFATNSDFLITISLEPNVVDLNYFKLWILLDQIIWVWNIKGLQHRVLKILRFKYLNLFRRLNSFLICNLTKLASLLILSVKSNYRSYEVTSRNSNFHLLLLSSSVENKRYLIFSMSVCLFVCLWISLTP